MHHLLNGKSKNLSLYSMNIIKDYISIFIIWYLIIYESQTTFILNHFSHPQKMIIGYKIMRGRSGGDMWLQSWFERQARWEYASRNLLPVSTLKFSAQCPWFLLMPLFYFSFKSLPMTLLLTNWRMGWKEMEELDNHIRAKIAIFISELKAIRLNITITQATLHFCLAT